MKFIAHFLLNALFIWLIARYAGDQVGIVLSGENTYVSALIFSFILALVGVTIGAIFRFFLFPFNILTFGLVGFCISFLMIWFADRFYDSIQINGILAYLSIAFIPAVSSMLLGKK